jgi:hypothetical protein
MQYTDTVKITATTPAARDAQGNYSLAASTTTELKGRWEVGVREGSDAFVPVVDGKRIEYSGVVYLPRHTPHPPLGAKVEVYEGLRMVAKGTVKYFSTGKFNCRLWL